MHLFFSVGEPSGDLHAAKLIRELSRRNPDLRCSAYGGPLMEEAGCNVLFRLTDLAVMGFLRVVPLLLRFYRLLRDAGRIFETDRPDAVVLVDFPGFNWWIARRAHHLGIPVFYYLPPQLWGWAPWRVKRMRRFVDHVLCCLPFEVEWYRKRGVQAEFVGHPFFDEVHERQLDSEAMDAMTPPGTKSRTVAILPGSRRHELMYNFGMQAEVMRRLHEKLPDVRFLVACYKESHRDFCRNVLAIAGGGLPVELHVGRTPEIIESASVALMVSGSVSLELLARKTPAVVVYHLGRMLQALKPIFVTCRYISLPNLIADRLILPEFTPSGDGRGAIAEMTAILHRWLTDPVAHARSVGDLSEVSAQVATTGASAHAAAAILKHLERRRTMNAEHRSAA